MTLGPALTLLPQQLVTILLWGMRNRTTPDTVFA